jgi:shikimate kinase
MQINRHIFLTGFMGSGKSQLGKKLAALLGTGFIDLDLLISQQEKKSVPEIFQQAGEEEFRRLERVYLERIISEDQVSVIALGGGTVCFNNNLARVKEAGILVYIELNAAALFDRLKNGAQGRPLLKGLSGDAMLQKITKLLQERKTFYEQAHVTVKGVNLTVQALCNHILESGKIHSSD